MVEQGLIPIRYMGLVYLPRFTTKIPKCRQIYTSPMDPLGLNETRIGEIRYFQGSPYIDFSCWSFFFLFGMGYWIINFGEIKKYTCMGILSDSLLYYWGGNDPWYFHKGEVGSFCIVRYFEGPWLLFWTTQGQGERFELEKERKSLKMELEHPYWQTHLGYNIPGTQMTPALIGKGLLLEGGDEQVPGIYVLGSTLPLCQVFWGWSSTH